MTDSLQIPLFLVTALQCEANPLIEHFKLKPVNSRPFREFRRKKIRLIVSGMGKINAAAATAALLHRNRIKEKGVCLNVGIAGHGSLDFGQSFIAHRISDTSSGSDWYPQMTFKPHCSTSQLNTIEAPSTDYPDNTGLDMEASAFFPIATRYTSAELCQVLKVVSDTPEHPMENLNKHNIYKLVRDAMPDIITSIKGLNALAKQQYQGSKIFQLTARYKEFWRLSPSQETKLHRLLERHQALFQSAPEPNIFEPRLTTREMIHQLELLVSESRHKPL